MPLLIPEWLKSKKNLASCTHLRSQVREVSCLWSVSAALLKCGGCAWRVQLRSPQVREASCCAVPAANVARVWLCSDGIWDRLSPQEVTESACARSYYSR